MKGDTRPLTDYEMDAWEDYELVIDSIPNARMYDRVSVMKAFPKLQAAFDRACAASTFYRLKNE